MLTPETCFLCPQPMARSTAIRLAGPIAGRQQTITLHPACAVRFAQQVLAAFDTSLTLDYGTARRISDHSVLTSSEQRVLAGVINGLTNPQIAAILGITLSTVKNHLSDVYAKLHVENRAQAAVYALEHDLVESAR